MNLVVKRLPVMLGHCSNFMNNHQTNTTWRQFHYEEGRQHLRVNRVVIANVIDRYRNNNYYQAGKQEDLDIFNIVWFTRHQTLSLPPIDLISL